MLGWVQYVEGMKMVSYDLMDAIKTPPDESVFQHYIDSAGEAVEAFADKLAQVTSAPLDAIKVPRESPCCAHQYCKTL